MGLKRFLTKPIAAVAVGMSDPQTPKSLKYFLVASVIYLVVPIDLIPDVMPVVGLADDFGILAISWYKFYTDTLTHNSAGVERKLDEWSGGGHNKTRRR